MSGHKSSDRVRATRLRRKQHPTPAERAWLREYERTRKRTGPFVSGVSPSDPSAPSASSSTATSPVSSPSTDLPAGAAADELPPGHEPVSFPAEVEDRAPDAAPGAGPQEGPRPGPGERTGSGHGAPLQKEGQPYHTPSEAPIRPMSCGKPDCIGCQGGLGAYVCTTTGRTIWPPMAEASAEMLGSGMLATVSLIGKMARKDKLWVPPDEKTVERMTKAVIAVTYRRLNAIGAIDDILQVTGALTLHALAVARAPTPPKKEGEGT